jgi:hypothetical protein
MELRKAEEIIDELSSIYESLRQSTYLKPEQIELLPALPPPYPPPQLANITTSHSESTENSPVVTNSHGATTAETSTVTELAADTTNIDYDGGNKTVPIISIADLETLVRFLQKMEEALLHDLPSKTEKFRKRLAELDPVTEKPRYGPKSQARVQRLIQIYDFLCRQHLFHSNSPTGEELPSSPSSLLFQDLKNQYQTQQQQTLQLQEMEAQTRIQEEQRKQRLQQEREAQQQALAAEQAAQRAAQEQAELEFLRQQAEEARRMRRMQEEARRQQERDWLDSILKGTDGVRQYINVIKEETAMNPEAQAKALQSLYTIFDQIQRHPEEVNFRKIRKNHPAFHQDIGRHNGGIELLIAAGFRPIMLPAAEGPSDSIAVADSSAGSGTDEESMIPTVACLVSKEPDLEHDMDGWTAWYDLNKATLELLQKEVQKFKR